MSNLILFFDTETSGLPAFKLPSTDPSQPHLVDICGQLYTPEGEKVDEFEALIRPDGWVIPSEVAAIHGITTEQAMAEGIPEAEALAGFMALHDRAGVRVAHNTQFDDRIMRIALLRFMGQLSADAYKACATDCTMTLAKPIMQLPPTAKMVKAGFGRQFKQPNLTEAIKYFFGEDLIDAHRARTDTEACVRVWFAIQAMAAAA